jgi:hypothetical protein
VVLGKCSVAYSVKCYLCGIWQPSCSNHIFLEHQRAFQRPVSSHTSPNNFRRSLIMFRVVRSRKCVLWRRWNILHCNTKFPQHNDQETQPLQKYFLAINCDHFASSNIPTDENRFHRTLSQRSRCLYSCCVTLKTGHKQEASELTTLSSKIGVLST